MQQMTEQEKVIIQISEDDPTSLSDEELRLIWRIDTSRIYTAPPGEVNPAPHFFLANEKSALLLRMLAVNKPVDLKKLKDFEAKTLLVLAVKLGPVGNEVVAYILDHIDDFGGKTLLGMQDDQGRTALHYACLYGDTQSIEKMFKLGVNASVQDRQGVYPEDYLFKERSEKVLAIGKEVDMSFERSIDARNNYLTEPSINAKYGEAIIRNGKLEIHRPLIQHPEDLRKISDKKKLIYIVKLDMRVSRPITEQEREKILKLYSYLQNERRVIDFIEKNREAAKEVFLLAKYRLRDASEAELGKGLRNAAVQKNAEDISRFIAAGANPAAASPSNGKTPLHYAVEKNAAKVVALLIQHKADASQADNTGETALALAMRLGNSEVQKALQNAEATREEKREAGVAASAVAAPAVLSALANQGFIAKIGLQPEAQQEEATTALSNLAI
jgi:ankyrin repeat protein